MVALRVLGLVLIGLLWGGLIALVNSDSLAILGVAIMGGFGVGWAYSDITSRLLD